MRIIFILLLLSLFNFSFSQDEWWKGNNSTEGTTVQQEEKHYTEGNIKVIKSSSVDKLIKFKATAVPPNRKPLQDGFRVQLFFDQNKTEVDEARKTVLRDDIEIETYVLYKAPNYVLLMGNYRSQIEAEKARSKFLHVFPEAIVVQDRIEFPRIPELPLEEEE